MINYSTPAWKAFQETKCFHLDLRHHHNPFICLFFNINDKKIYSIIIIRRGSLKKTARLWERSLTFSNIFKSVRLTIANKRVKPLNSQDLISNSPYCLPNDSHYVNLENLVSDQSSHINCMADSKENYS